jgi:hypothetical protein
MAGVKPVAASRVAHNAFGLRAFNNAIANRQALKKMTAAERETGMTAAQLAQQQRELREQFYARRKPTN